MTENEQKKSVKDLVKTFDSNQNGEVQKPKPKNATQKEKIPLFPTLKKLPSNVNNKYTEEKNQKNDIKPVNNKKEESSKNPFSFFWNKSKNKKVNDDSNLISEKKSIFENNKDITPPPEKRRNTSDNKKKEKKKILMFSEIQEPTNQEKNNQEKTNQEQSTGDIPEVDEPVVPLTNKETEELLKDPKFANVKKLKQYTDNEFNKTVTDKNKGHSNIVKSLVSQDKTRFCYDGFDLDLTYITTNIIAMGFPSSAIEGIYRNSMGEVKAFFGKRHPNHYKVYNLCDDKTYAKDCFYRQGYFPFKDHEAPPLNLIRPFCEDAKQFLDEDPQNVIAVHCKAGKGRTGTFICCLLLYMNIFETAEECLLYYGLMRVGTVKGVTVPSQIRYVHYFESILKNKIPHPITFKTITIRNIIMYTIPKFGKKKFVINFTIENNDKIIKYSDINKKKESYTITNYDLPFINFPMSVFGHTVSGDVKFTFFQVQLLKNEKIFKFWFNTNFLPANGVYEIKKEAIDKACKDKKCKIYKEDFKIEIEFMKYS